MRRGAAAAEVLGAVAVATGAVAALQGVAPAAGLGVIYLLAVLEVAIRRGELAALTSAVLSVLTLNYLYITPRHRLAIAHKQDVIELAVFLIAAVVVGRLASVSRRRSHEAETRAMEALARQREAALLAQAASAVLGGRGPRAALERIGVAVAQATGAGHARIALEPVPAPEGSELVLPLRCSTSPAWLYLGPGGTWRREDLQRVADPLGRLLDVALERERVAELAAEADAANRAEVARTAVLHAISHDLRSPLTAITTAGSALRSPGVTESDRDELLDVISEEARRLARLVDDLLDLSRIQAGAASPREDWCDLLDTVATAAAQVGSEHRIEFALPPELPLVRADAAQLERVFFNLIENAVKFSPPGEPVRLSAACGGGRVTVRVSDRGRGIAARDRPRVFEPFFRAGARTTSGSGLGLAICRGFVEANGGQIALQSGTGEGTSFAVSFPLVAQPQTVP